MPEGLLLKEEVYAVVGATIEVHRVLGAGFLEAVYQEAFEIELLNRGVPFAAQAELGIVYKSTKLKKTYIADILAYNKIVVELKALDRLTGREEAQILNYLKVTHFAVGVLINFGSLAKLEWKRFAHTRS